MERYYKASEVEAIICKLMREPYYQHEEEDFKAGVSAVEGELMFIDAVELEEPKEATKGLHLGHQYYCSNCGELTYMYKYCASCGAKVKE